ncbi:MAG TPA: CBS domain-containing protein, partial [Gammaproteobacteria bacterium]
QAAQLMRDEHVGDLIVIETREGRTVPIGVVTDRDIVVEVVAKGVDPTDVTVGDAMSSDLLSVHEDNGIEYALREMQRMGVRRVPVVNEKGALTGVLAIDDVLEHLALELTRIAGAIRIERDKEIQSRP